MRFRDIIQENKKEYLDPKTKKLEKAHIAKRIVDEIRNKNPPGRFLKEDASDGYLWDIGDGKAIKKVRSYGSMTCFDTLKQHIHLLTHHHNYNLKGWTMPSRGCAGATKRD